MFTLTVRKFFSLLLRSHWPFRPVKVKWSEILRIIQQRLVNVDPCVFIPHAYDTSPIKTILFVYLINCGIAVKEVLLTRGRRHNVHCSLWISVDCESNATPVDPITAGSVKLPDWLIREAEVTLEYDIRAHKKVNRKRGSHAKGQLLNFIEPSAREQKDWKKSKKTTSEDKWRCRKSEMNEWRETNKMRDMSKWPN